MRIFDISKHMEHIMERLEAEQQPDAEILKVFLEEGPKAIEDWAKAILNLEEEVKGLNARLREVRKRRDHREKQALRMREQLTQIVTENFSGPVRALELTVWVQNGTLCIRK